MCGGARFVFEETTARRSNFHEWTRGQTGSMDSLVAMDGFRTFLTSASASLFLQSPKEFTRANISKLGVVIAVRN